VTSRGPIHYVASRDGVRIAWTAIGTGPSLIFVPPWPATIESEVWRRFTGGLFDGRLVTYDRRGFGLSDWGVEHGFEQYADDLEAVADAAGIDAISLYAQAAGTWESVVLAARTARVRRMLLDEPPFRTLPEDGFIAQRSLLGLLDGDFATFWKAFLQFALGWGEGADIEALAGYFVSATNPVDIRAMFTALDGADLTPFAPLVEAECLVYHNVDDAAMPPTAAANLARLIPNARLLLTSGRRWSRDEATRTEIRSFLATDGMGARTGAPPAGRGEALVARDARGLLPREVQGLECVANGATNREIAASGARNGGNAHPDSLSRQEAEVLRLLATGLRNREIADLLVVSERTIERHVTNIYRKLDLRSRAEATAWALRSGLI